MPARAMNPRRDRGAPDPTSNTSPLFSPTAHPLQFAPPPPAYAIWTPFCVAGGASRTPLASRWQVFFPISKARLLSSPFFFFREQSFNQFSLPGPPETPSLPVYPLIMAARCLFFPQRFNSRFACNLCKNSLLRPSFLLFRTRQAFFFSFRPLSHCLPYCGRRTHETLLDLPFSPPYWIPSFFLRRLIFGFLE